VVSIALSLRAEVECRGHLCRDRGTRGSLKSPFDLPGPQSSAGCAREGSDAANGDAAVCNVTSWQAWKSRTRRCLPSNVTWELNLSASPEGQHHDTTS
jgi:hypothetical protein